jgi:hypothetical protein
MTKRLIASMALIATVLVAMVGVLGSASAQDSATPAMDGHTMGSTAHPAHIHTGTCDTLGDVVFPLNDVTSGDTMATPVATPSLAMASTPVAGAPATSITTVDVALDDIISGGHAINVHESVEMIDVYIACGDVTGEATDGMLTVELQELNGSGSSGEAMLTDNGDGTTTVEIHLMQSGSDMATPVA